MTEEQIVQRERELREQFPAMFSHEECRPGEVWIGDQIVDVVHTNAYLYRKAGLTSVRVGNTKLRKTKLSYLSGGRKHEEECEIGNRGIFVNLREYLSTEEASKQKDQ